MHTNNDFDECWYETLNKNVVMSERFKITVPRVREEIMITVFHCKISLQFSHDSFTHENLKSDIKFYVEDPYYPIQLKCISLKVKPLV